jgi:hypothetical protein
MDDNQVAGMRYYLDWGEGGGRCQVTIRIALLHTMVNNLLIQLDVIYILL